MQEKLVEERIKSLVSRIVKVKPETITNDLPLIGSGLGLDSVAVLELVSAIEQEFLLKIDDENISPQLFRSVNTMARYVREKLAEIAQITESTKGE